MIYYCVMLLVLPNLIDAESYVWFGPNVFFDLDEILINEKSNIKCPEKEQVNLSNLGLKEIPRGIVKSDSIKTIRLDNNKIKMIRSDEFDRTPNLECLSISNNSIPLEGLKLRHPGVKTFIFDHQSLSELEMNNIISNDFSPQSALEARFPNVEILSWRGINYNFLNVFLTTFPKLTTIDLADSNLTYVDKSISVYAPNLKSIHLERNSIRHIFLEDFRGIHELYLDKNPIMGLDVPDKFNNLTVLSLSGCFDADTPIQINLLYLQSLDLSNNQISRLVADMFDGAPNLEHLNLSHNKLEKFPDLSNLISLRKLSLSYNNLTRITSIFVSPSLKTLNLRGNDITRIEKLAFSNLTNLEVLDLSENKLDWLPEEWTSSMVSLRSLNLSSNRFSSIKVMNVGQSRNLLHLCVKNNYFSSINSNSLQNYVPNGCTVFV